MSVIKQDSFMPSIGGSLSLPEKLNALFLRRGTVAIQDREIRPAYRGLLAKLGNPHKKLPPVIHVAGTNGKGSVVAYMKAILEDAGYSVHCYTSPHLIRYNERIVIAGQEIDDLKLEELLDRVLALESPQSPLDFFELTSSLAFTAFSEHHADILLLETGLGGRLDCTNVIENPVATVITSISYDHTDVLGNNLSDIAYEKSGIFKQDAPCFIGRQDSDAVVQILRDRAEELNCPVFQCGKEWGLVAENERFVFIQQHCRNEFYPLPSLKGTHQIDNAGLAIETLKNIGGFIAAAQNIENGLQNAIWPGRLQKLDYRYMPDGWELWLDSGHNEGAGKILAEQAKVWQDQDGKPLHIIISMMQSKDADGFLKPLAPYFDSLIAIPMKAAPVGMKTEILCRIARESGIGNVCEAATFADAVRKITGEGVHSCNIIGSGRILIAGSVYLAGTVLSETDM